MKKCIVTLLFITVCLVIPAAPAPADEGMWLLTALEKLPLKELRARGLKLTLQEFYNPNGPSLKDAIVLLGGGTGEFVSPNGLMLTNHHVAYGALQRNSTPAADYITNGFHAAALGDELPARGYTAQIVEIMRDVTPRMKKAIETARTGTERDTLLNRESRLIAAEAAGADKDLRAVVQEMNGGQEYILFVYRVIRDVRLVYSPPLSIGNFGGETDNWMWPRHTGDFSFMRAYVAPDGNSAEYAKTNVPYKPKSFLKISAKGTKAGDLVFVMGFPGRTFRYRTSYEVRFDQEINFPLYVAIQRANIDAIEEFQRRDKATEIKYAGRVKSLYNGYKNRLGMIEGLRRIRLVEKKRQEESALKAWIDADADRKSRFGDILPAFERIYGLMDGIASRQIAFQALLRASILLNQAVTIARWQAERRKPDGMRAEGFHDADSAAVGEILARKVEDLDLEERQLGNVLGASGEVPLNNRLLAMASVAMRKEGRELQDQLHGAANTMLRQTRLLKPEERLACLRMSSQEFDADPDPLIQFARNLYNESTTFTGVYTDLTGQIDDLRPRWIEALAEWKKTYLYPDANRTLRLNWGSVAGCSARDGMAYLPYTTLAGVIDKNRGKEPFDVPEKLRALAAEGNTAEYRDPELGDVPVAFLSDNDITGGNSGSPVLNGKGEIVGCAFDGIWEGLTNDFAFDKRTSRTISVDSRYVLFILDKFAGAKNVLAELTIVR